VRLLLAGEQEQAIREMLRTSYAPLVDRGQIVCLAQILPLHSLLDALSAMDLVCALYPGHIGSASIAIRAAAAKRPVLAHTYGWVGAVVPRFGLGTTCDALQPSTLQRCLRDALDDASSFTPGELAERFVRFHSVENFKACCTAEIRRHLRLPPAPGQRSWDWVLEAERTPPTPLAAGAQVP
jgi:hypothetical protein